MHVWTRASADALLAPLVVHVGRRVSLPLLLVAALAALVPGVMHPARASADDAGERRLAPLDAWRQVQEACKEAVRAPSATERVTRCEEFLTKHPRHEDMKPLLQALVDAYVETGEFEAERVGALLEKMAALDDSGYYEPIRLVDNYHLKYGLPLDSGRRLLDMSRERFAREREKLDRIDDPKDRQRQEMLFDY